MLEQQLLVALVHLVQPLFNGVHRGGLGGHLHADGIVQDLFRKLRDLLGHGGGEQEGLPPLRQAGDDLAHVVDKAHVQHPVRLVQHKGLNPVQPDVALIAQIVEPARRGHQHVHPPLQRLHLGPLAHAAEDDRVAYAQILAVLVKALLDLQGQLPGGGQHQGADGGVLLVHTAVEPLQNGNGEGRRLAGARLGAADQVSALQHRGDSLGLNGGGLDVPQLLHRPQQLWQKFQFVKCHGVPFWYGFRPGRGAFLLYTLLDGNAIPLDPPCEYICIFTVLEVQ